MGKRRTKLKLQAMHDQVSAELSALVGMANSVANWVRSGAVMQFELGKAIERVGDQQIQLQSMIDEFDRGFESQQL
jgi:hypothetical protein